MVLRNSLSAARTELVEQLQAVEVLSTKRSVQLQEASAAATERMQVRMQMQEHPGRVRSGPAPPPGSPKRRPLTRPPRVQLLLAASSLYRRCSAHSKLARMQDVSDPVVHLEVASQFVSDVTEAVKQRATA
jgi:hypothetical protein